MQKRKRLQEIEKWVRNIKFMPIERTQPWYDAFTQEAYERHQLTSMCQRLYTGEISAASFLLLSEVDIKNLSKLYMVMLAAKVLRWKGIDDKYKKSSK